MPPEVQAYKLNLLQTQGKKSNNLKRLADNFAQGFMGPSADVWAAGIIAYEILSIDINPIIAVMMKNNKDNTKIKSISDLNEYLLLLTVSAWNSNDRDFMSSNLQSLYNADFSNPGIYLSI